MGIWGLVLGLIAYLGLAAMVIFLSVLLARYLWKDED